MLEALWKVKITDKNGENEYHEIYGTFSEVEGMLKKNCIGCSVKISASWENLI